MKKMIRFDLTNGPAVYFDIAHICSVRQGTADSSVIRTVDGESFAIRGNVHDVYQSIVARGDKEDK